ncbi:EamA family transporter [Spirosoma sp. HMF4905]|uniref:EamA family transporter n=1 Tax=Spirosoma arboris TaxID=2682092 RepID=A0A7K1SE77_9BACT|nr:DMT family transporter [Spirosoma arboris]MVM32091.1 EamA family transporter [Spirosoma arboris]
MTSTSSSANKWLYFIALSLIWGSSYILIKKGLEGFGYVAAATIRLVAAGVAFLPFALRYFRHIPRKKLPIILLSSLLSMLIPSYLFSLSQEHIQSSVAGILIAVTPSFTFLVSTFFFKNTYSYSQLIGLLLGLSCSVALSLLSSDGSTLSVNVYVFLVIGATLCYGLNINIVKYYLADIPPLQLSAVSVTMNGLLAFFFVAIPNYEIFQFSHASIGPVAALLTLGLLGTALAQLLHTKLIQSSSPLFASTTTYVIPIVAIFWGILDNEPFTFGHFVACLGILISVYLVRREKKLVVT